MNLGQARRGRSAVEGIRAAGGTVGVRVGPRLGPLVAMIAVAGMAAAPAAEPPLRVGAAAVEIPADDAMDMAGGILAWKANGAEAPLRATAVVLAGGDEKLAICSCDVLFVQRDFIDPALERIRAATGIGPDRILVHATHTHAAPSATRIHGYDRDERFVAGLTEAIIDAIVAADADLARHPDCRLRYRLGEESSVGQNSRLLLSDGTIFWTGDHADAVRPTGPFDTDLPVVVLETAAGGPIATLFNHATHTIGGREPGRRSPAFYGLAAQELEGAHGGVYLFLQGASGSTHNLTLGAAEMVVRIKAAVERAAAVADVRAVPRLAAAREPFQYRVRAFDEAEEEAAVTGYCSTRFQSPEAVAATAEVFRRQRAELAPHQGETRTTWIQTLLVGDVAIVGVPAEFFTVLGQDIKRRSPFRHTIVAELSGDWIGYLPDREGHRLGGYQTWTGHHSHAEPGTGERVVAAALVQLARLHDASHDPASGGPATP
jgi:neutral ceramidase